MALLLWIETAIDITKRPFSWNVDYLKKMYLYIWKKRKQRDLPTEINKFYERKKAADWWQESL